jgi:peptide/nickel transport system permease protein
VSGGTAELLVEAETDVSVASEIAARSPLQLFWRRLRKDKVALIALGFVLFMLFMAIFAPLIVNVLGLPDPKTPNDNLLDDFGQPSGPTGEHLMGVDERGRDVFSRVIYGARGSLEVAFIATAITLVVGVTVGMSAGYFRGKFDTIVSRVMDLFLAFPVLVLAIGIGVACADGCGPLQPGLPVVIFVISLTSWP